MKIDTNYIEKLARILSENGLSEIALEDEDCSITIRRENGVAPVLVKEETSHPSALESVLDDSIVENAEPEVKIERKAITSPMVGTFYAASSPDSEPMISVGDNVKKGDVVCIVEAMKLMNEIVSEVSGKVVEICVEDGQPVEFGQILMYVE